VLDLTGSFWQREYFDHLIRMERDLTRIVRYASENPLKASLVNWPWVYVCENLGTWGGGP
jgi:menaquinone-specific isochorismate synthase